MRRAAAFVIPGSWERQRARDVAIQWKHEALTVTRQAHPTNLPLVTALREQFGLRLEARREETDVLVIERAVRPGPD